MKTIPRLLQLISCFFVSLLILTSAPAGEIKKAPNGDPLDSISSWLGGFAPSSTNVAAWDVESLGNSGSPPLLDLTWQGIRLGQSTFPGTLSFPGGSFTLSLGGAGIDMSASDMDLDLNNSFISILSNQVWSVRKTRTLTMYSENGAGTGGVSKEGAGTLRLYYPGNGSHFNNGAQLGLGGGMISLEGSSHNEIVGSTHVYRDSTRIQSVSGGTLVMNDLTRSVGGVLDTVNSITLTTTTNDASENGGILSGWATVFGQFWATVAPGGGNQPIQAFPTFYSVDFIPTANINLPFTPGGYTLTNTTGTAINSLRFDGDQTLTLGTSGSYSLTNLTGGILMGSGAILANIVSSSTLRTLKGPAGGDLIFHVPFPFQILSNQAVIVDNAGCGLTKAGDGTLILNPNINNSYTGLTSINGGLLRTGNAPGRRYVSSALLINPNGTYLHGTGDNNLTLTTITLDGGRLDLNGAGDSCTALTLANDGTIVGFNPVKTLTAGNLATPVNARWGWIDVALNAPGGLIKTTDRKVGFSRNSLLSGTNRVENGALQVFNDATVNVATLVLGTSNQNGRVVLGGTYNGVGFDTPGYLSVTNLFIQNPGPLISAIVGGSALIGSALILNYAHDTNFDLTWLGGPGPFENSVGLTKTGPGVLTLTNVGSFTGLITNQTGTLKLTSAANINGRVVYVNGGLLDVNGASPEFTLYGAGNVSSGVSGPVTLSLGGSFDGTISDGSGNVSVIVAGQLILNGNNTYSGDTVVTNFGQFFLSPTATLGSGTLRLYLCGLNLTSSRAIPVTNPLEIAGDAYIQGYNAGVIDMEFSSDSVFGSTGKLIFISGTSTDFEPRFTGRNFAFNLPIGLTNGPSGAFTRFNSANTNGSTQVYNGVISGDGGFRRTATAAPGGHTLLNAVNTYTGPTLVDNGTLWVNGWLSTNIVTVTNLGVLGGTGTIRGPVRVHNGGTLSPGTSLGILTISNSLVFSNGATAFMELYKDFLTNDVVSGLASVTYGGTLSLTNLGGTLTNGDSFKLFNASNYAGAFTNVMPPTPGAGLVWDTSGLVTNGILRIAEAAHFNAATLSGTNLVISGSGGPANGGFSVWTSTNPALPLTNWVFLSSNNFSSNGTFVFTNGILLSTPQRYFILRLP